MLQPVFASAGPEAFATQRKNYIGLEKIKQIKQLHGKGVGPSEIAKSLKISTATVYRYLPKEEVVAQPEQTATEPVTT